MDLGFTWLNLRKSPRQLASPIRVTVSVWNGGLARIAEWIDGTGLRVFPLKE
jgi:hypothetical protein